MSDYLIPATPNVNYNFDTSLTYFPPNGSAVNFALYTAMISGAAVADSAMVADLRIFDAAASGAAIGDSTALGDLTTTIGMAGTATADSTATGGLADGISGVAVEDSTASGNLTTTMGVAGEAIVDSTAIGELPSDFGGIADANSFAVAGDPTYLNFSAAHRYGADLQFSFDSSKPYVIPSPTIKFRFGPGIGADELIGDSYGTGDLTTSITMAGTANADSRIYMEQPLEAKKAKANSILTGDISTKIKLQSNVQSDSVATAFLSDGTIGVNAPPTVSQGFYLISPANDFYNRVHVNYQNLDVFEFIFDEPLKVKVWNSHYTSVPLPSVEAINTQSLEMFNEITTPFQPFETRDYLIRLTDYRQKDFDAQYRLHFANATRPDVITLTGRRIDVCPFHPDMHQPISDRKEWKTDVLTNYDGTEQRVMLRKIPRRHLKFNTFVPMNLQPLYQNLFYGLGGRPLAVPIWVEPMTLTKRINTGDQTFEVSTVDSDLAIGSLVILMSTDLVYQVARISSLTSTSITIETKAHRDWPKKSSTLYPLGTGTLSQSPTLSRFDPATAQGVLDFNLTGHINLTPAVDANPVYQGLPVLEDILNWDGNVQASFERKASKIDNETGSLMAEIEGKAPTKSQTFRRFLNSASKIRTFQKWLSARGGKLKPFWLPSGARDLELARDIGANDDFIVVKRTDYSTFVAQGVGGRDIRIQLTDGTIVYRRITASLALNSVEEQLTLQGLVQWQQYPYSSQSVFGYFIDGQWGGLWWVGQAVPISKVALISFMAPVRLEEDYVDVQHHGKDFATAEFNLKGIIYDV